MTNSPGGRIRYGFVLALVGIAALGPAEAHDARPLSIVISAQADGVYVARVRVPPSVAAANRPSLEWPESCEPASPSGPRSGAEAWTEIVTCSAPLAGQTVRFDYALFNPAISTMARLVPRAGSARTAVLPPDETAWLVPRAPSTIEVAGDYLRLGIEHIWAGVDHLLFVIGLLLLARTGRRIVLVITGFTLAHSFTLSLAALGIVDPAVAPIEAAIALSILFLAAEIARPRAAGLAWRYPLLVSSSFGLLHGLGFAAALGEIGLPADEQVTALLFFNLGVEAGQIAFILPFLGIARARPAIEARSRAARAAAAFTTRKAAPYAIGVPASFWLVERLTAF